MPSRVRSLRGRRRRGPWPPLGTLRCLRSLCHGDIGPATGPALLGAEACSVGNLPSLGHNRLRWSTSPWLRSARACSSSSESIRTSTARTSAFSIRRMRGTGSPPRRRYASGATSVLRQERRELNMDGKSDAERFAIQRCDENRFRSEGPFFGGLRWQHCGPLALQFCRGRMDMRPQVILPNRR